MKLSIIVPALNEEKMIVRLIKSIRKHTFLKSKDYEIIVVDGGSKDKTVSMARKYASKVIALNKRGIGCARNVGAKVSKSSNLIFIDADTVIDSDVITYVYNYMVDSKKLLCGVVRLRISLNGWWPRLVFKIMNFFNRMFSYTKKPYAVSAFMFFNKTLFNKIGGFKVDIDGAEDHDIVRRALKYGAFKFLNNQSIIFDGRRLKKLGTTKWVFVSLGNIRRIFRGNKATYPTIDEL